MSFYTALENPDLQQKVAGLQSSLTIAGFLMYSSALSFPQVGF